MTPTRFRSHWIPRTTRGKVATVLYVALFALAMPPVTHVVFDRPGQWVVGVPFFFFALLIVYSVLIGVLIWAYRGDL